MGGMLGTDHELKAQLLEQIRTLITRLVHIRDVNKESIKLEGAFVQDTLLEDVCLSDGIVRVRLQIRDEYYYHILSELCGIRMESEYDLIHTMKDLAQMKEEYVKVQSAIDSVRGTGYGVVIPELEEIEIEEPAVIRQGNKFGVKIKSKKSVYSYDKSKY